MSVVKVECHGCKAPYEVEERRIPATGLKMKCPKCGASLLVAKPGGADAGAELPMPARQDLPVAKKAAPAPPPRPAAAKAAAPAAPSAPKAAGAPPPAAPKPPPPAQRPSGQMTVRRPPEVDEADLPAARPVGAPRPTASTKRTGAFGEIDLAVDLPSPSAFGGLDDPGADADLPAVQGFAPAARAGTATAARPGTQTKQQDFGAVDFGVDESDLAEDLPALPTGQTGRGFGEIEGFADVDLPAIHTGRTGPRKPAPSGHEDLPSAAGSTGLPEALARATRSRGQQESFGEIDLPLVQRGETRPRSAAFDDDPAANASSTWENLPAAFRSDTANARDGSFGEIDLPLVGSEPEPEEHGLPLVAPGPGLPQTAGAALPTPAFGAGLPVPSAGGALPVAASGSALPIAVGGGGLPTAAGGGALPVAVGGGGLPTAAGGGALPVAASGGALPVAASGGSLPTAAGGGVLPSALGGASLPVALGGGSLPSVGPGGVLPAAVFGGGLPATAQYGGLPAVSGAGLPSVGGAGLPAISDAAMQREQDFGEIEHDLGLAPAGANPYDDSDRIAGAGPVSAGARSAQIGDEADLAAQPVEPAPRSRPAVVEELPQPKRSPKLRIAAAVIAFVGISGGALALVPEIGPFGANFIGDKINASAQDRQLDELRARVDAALDEDTSGAVGRVFDEAKQAHAAMPRHRRTAALAAFVALARGLRFGKRGDDEAYAKQALLEAKTEPTLEKTTAEAALAVYGDAARGAPVAKAAAQAAPTNLDLAALSGEAELAAKSKGARDAWKRAVAIKPTGRTLYGLARAAMAAGDVPGARDAATKAIAASPSHAAARVLLANILWTTDGNDAQANAQLKAVTDDPKVRSVAANSELVAAYTALGGIALVKSRTSAAELAFGAAVKLDPQAVEALVGNGELFYRAGRYSEALARFEAATRADAANVIARVGIARSYLALERMQEAKALLKKIEESAPKSPLVQLWLGHADEALGNRKDAEAAYAKSIKEGGDAPETVDAYVALAHLLSVNGRPEEAAAKLGEASAKFPELPALYRAKGEVALQAGQYDEAKKELEAALAKEDNIGTRFLLGKALRRLREFEAAGKAFDTVAEGDKDTPGLALERGLLFWDMGETDKAIEMYSAALKKAPNDIDLKLRVGSTQVIAGHGEQAEKILREVIRERASSAEVNHFLGRAILLNGGNQAEAQRFLQKGVDFDPNRAEYHLYLGWIANDANNIALADMELKRALELDHDLGDAYWQRGVLLQKQGQTVDALAALATALAKRPSRFEAYASMAFCYQDQLKWPEAEAAWRKAIAGNDGVPEWHYRLGKQLTTHGDRGAALEELEKSLKADDGQKAPPTWTHDAHFLVAEGLRATNKEKAAEHYRRFLALAPSNNAYRQDAERALKQLGPPPQ